jgi:BirA family biotin operon repressor/biotin-[acetyl-CoA-carboxylase] ligase
VETVAEIASTNRELLARAASGAPEGLVLVADHQTAGRGRLDRTWEAPPRASLLVSVLLRPSLPVEDRHLLTVAAGLAAVEAVAAAAGVAASLKWPNDVLVGDRKLAGILAEAAGDAVVVGMGLNVDWPELPAHLASTATSLQLETGGPVGRDAVLGPWVDGFGRRYEQLGTAAGRSAMVAEHRACCSTLGRAVRVTLAGEELLGTATDIDPTGALVVTTAGGPRWVVAGDVVHLRPT